jgi:hypothetical protein
MSEQNGKVDNKTYDIFISHKSDCKPWVRVLARNLKEQGYKVFLDEWELVPGKSIAEGLYYKGLKQSRKGILVATPGAFESAWVKEEYHQMMIQKQEDKDFVIIPLVLGKEIPDFPFMKDILWVDFRDPDKYRESFYRLLCAIEGKSPGPDGKFEADLTLPQQSKEPIKPGKDELSFVEGLFELFFTKQAVVLLAQADRWQGGAKSHILEQAINRFGEKNVLHLVPPFGQTVDMKDFFAQLGKQCFFPRSITGSVKLGTVFVERLNEGGMLFLMISGFENSCQEGQKELAGVLRALNERFQNLKILICGGEKLADLYYSGDLSYLNQAEISEWPEMTVVDVQRTAKDACVEQAIDVDEKIAVKLLEISGGHPGVLEICFDLHAENPNFTLKDLMEKLVHSFVMWRLFMPFRKDPVKKKQVCELLNQEDVGPAQPYIFDCLLKALYWKNLLKRGTNNHRLYWRCEVLRLVGQQILVCEKKYGE